MIKIVMKNEAILEVDANGFREEENTIWFDNGGVNVMVVNKSEFSYCFIVDEEKEKEKEIDYTLSHNLIEYGKRMGEVKSDGEWLSYFNELYNHLEKVGADYLIDDVKNLFKMKLY